MQDKGTIKKITLRILHIKKKKKEHHEDSDACNLLPVRSAE
jgi:hypothetical protein